MIAAISRSIDGTLRERLITAIVRLSDDDAFTKEEYDGLVRSLVSNRPDLAVKLSDPMPSVDFSVVKAGMRFRVNIVRAQGELTASLRPLPENPPLPKEIGFGEIVVKSIEGYTERLDHLIGPHGSWQNHIDGIVHSRC